MATLDWHTTGSDDVTLVELLVTSDSPEHIRIENCLNGPVWPPRRQGVPAAGWTDDGYEGVVAPDDRLVLGYASPADPDDPPARIASATPAGEAEQNELSPEDVVRALGDPTPPRDAIPTPGEGSVADPADRAESPASRVSRAGQEDRTVQAVAAYLDAVASRLDDAERLADASSPGEASDALAAVGGAENATDLREQLSADRRALARLARRSQALAARIDAVDVPAETLARVA